MSKSLPLKSFQFSEGDERIFTLSMCWSRIRQAPGETIGSGRARNLTVFASLGSSTGPAAQSVFICEAGNIVSPGSVQKRSYI